MWWSSDCSHFLQSLGRFSNRFKTDSPSSEIPNLPGKKMILRFLCLTYSYISKPYFLALFPLSNSQLEKESVKQWKR